MPMKNPPHPGRSIRTACLEPLGLSVTEGAKLTCEPTVDPEDPQRFSKYSIARRTTSQRASHTVNCCVPTQMVGEVDK